MARATRAGSTVHDEDWVKAEVKKILKEYEVLWYMPGASIYTITGAHDFICCARGIYVSIETKAGPKDKPTPLQKRFGRKVQRAKGYALRIHRDNYLQLRKFFELLYANKLPPGYYGSKWDD